MKNLRYIILFIFVACFIVTGHSQQTQKLPAPRNIIVLIGDGMGFNHIQAVNYFQGKTSQVYESFPVKLALSHYPAKAGEYEAGNPASNYMATGYNPALAWNDTAYLKKDFTESAASATALATGYKTYNNSIGMSVDHDTLENLVQWAKATGRAAGVVTSVQFSHATPAGFTAHNLVRSNYSEIAAEMLLDSRCDVIMGCGNPGYDKDGLPLADKWTSDKYVVDSTFWQQILKGSGKTTGFKVKGTRKNVSDADGDGSPDAWTVVQSLSEFRALLNGKTLKRVLGCPMVASTLQQGRTKLNGETDNSLPQTSPFITTVPALSEMAAGALNVLDNNRNGFFLMIEGGAIDWASHGNQKGRLIEEMEDFGATVESVVQWVEKNSNWEETLVVVTADHETGLLWGPEPFAPLKDQGKGNLPVMNFNSGDHSNSLVPFFAKGSGSELYKWLADEYDSVRGPFIQNSELATLIHLLWYKK
jgi:alkaline phosphatase